MGRLSNKTALITGGTTGIGLATARLFQQEGARVAITGQDAQRVALAARQLGAGALALRANVASRAEMEAVAQRLQAEFGGLDIVFANAGIAQPRPLAEVDEAHLDALIDVNFKGVVHTVQSMLPLLRKSPAGRIVNVSSSLGSLSVNSDPSSPYFAQRYIGYNASKAALNMLTIQLTEELRDAGIVVNSVSPGFVKTDLTGYGVMTPEEGAMLPVQHALGGTDNGRFIEPGGYTPW